MAEASAGKKVMSIPPEQIRENPENPRLMFRQDEMESLMLSIARNGVQVPVTVYQEGRHYCLIDGERRWRCAKKLNLVALPALVQDKPTELQNLLLMYNIHALREQWDYFTIASKLHRIIALFSSENGRAPTEGELSEVTGLTRGAIRRCQLILNLPERYKQMLLKELELPKSRQQLSEDFFIEMERSLKTIVRRLPEYGARIDDIREVLVAKFRKGLISAVTDFRKLSQIATAVNRFGFAQVRAKRALDDVFSSDSDVGIRDAYARTVEFAYDESKAVRQVESLNEYLQSVIEANAAGKLDAEFLGQLRTLMQRLRALLRS